ncbi:hypothetical protein, partial [Cloacibacillus evryensis]
MGFVLIQTRKTKPKSNRVGGLPLFERPSSGETTKRPAQLLVPYWILRSKEPTIPQVMKFCS